MRVGGGGGAGGKQIRNLYEKVTSMHARVLSINIYRTLKDTDIL
jgi:hypothetical protein